ncbi:GGDEF domain-containing protein [Aureimonas sp. D3]|uniref:GGDEF domain-containing protein n=1 Tax=Aureimonas sp. D3 TaxID=1638164 RepID=UPI00078492BB|nr:GGDEF domain-containing protein [Aureimonas sp. D3]
MKLTVDLDCVGVAMSIVDVESEGTYRFVGVNTAAALEIGIEQARVAGRLFQECLPADYAAQMIQRYDLCVRTQRVQDIEECVVLRGEPKWFRTTLTPIRDEVTGEITRVLGVSQNISGAKRLQAELQHYAYVDPLTGLPNRRRFDEAVINATEQSVYTHRGFSLAVVDLDQLKFVNDEWGHRLGDRMIRHAGEVLQAMIRPNEVVARVGGDEFYILLQVEERVLLDRRLDEIRSAIDRGIVLPGTDLPITLSVGAEIWKAGQDVRAVLSAADKAMYAEKAIRRLVRRIDDKYRADPRDTSAPPPSAAKSAARSWR